MIGLTNSSNKQAADPQNLGAKAIITGAYTKAGDNHEGVN